MMNNEDYIDFKVSDTWRDYYYEQGLTPYHSGNYLKKQLMPLIKGVLESMMSEKNDERIAKIIDVVKLKLVETENKLELLEQKLERLFKTIENRRKQESVKQEAGGKMENAKGGDDDDLLKYI